MDHGKADQNRKRTLAHTCPHEAPRCPSVPLPHTSAALDLDLTHFQRGGFPSKGTSDLYIREAPGEDLGSNGMKELPEVGQSDQNAAQPGRSFECG